MSVLKEAKTQNRISVHGHRLEAFKALLSFRGQLTAKGVHFKREATWGLWEHADIAEFYFSPAVASKLKSIVDLSLALQASRDEWSEDSCVSPPERKVLVDASYAQLENLRAAVSSTEQLMRKELSLVAAES